MYCKYCGQQLADGAILCPQCGLLMDEEVSKQLGAPQAAADSLPPAKRKNPVALVGFILSVAGGVLSVASLIGGAAEFLLLFAAVTLAGLVCSAVGLGLSKSRGAGKGFALAGVITAAIVIVGIIVLFILAFFAISSLFYFLFLLLIGAAG